MIRIFKRGGRPAAIGAAERFTGTVRTDLRFAADAPGTASGALVMFDPGARTAWHTHPLGQTLIVMTGVGRVQEWGGPVREIRQGDTVWFPPGVKHWHGAAPDTPMSHLAIAERQDGVSAAWAEPVDDAQYRGEKTEARSGEMRIRMLRNGSLPSAAGPGATFTGRVRLDQPFSGDAPARIGGAHVTFEPGARTAWHTHPGGQTLIVTSGAGLVQQWGGPVQAIQPGDVVWLPPGVKHWHGAAPKTAMGHIAIAESLDGKAVDWMEKVDDGLTVNEIKEVLVQLYAYAGFPRSLNAINAFSALLDERRAAGKQDPVGRDASPLSVSVDKNELGGRNRAVITGRPEPATPSGYAAFAPVIDQFLKEHLFADIFARDVLTFRQREIATIGALAGLEGTDAQLRAHLRGGLNAGLTEAQVRRVIAAIGEKVGVKEGEKAGAVFDEVLKNRPAATATPPPATEAMGSGPFLVEKGLD